MNPSRLQLEPPKIAYHVDCTACNKWVYHFWADHTDHTFCGLCHKDLGESTKVIVKLQPITAEQIPLEKRCL